MQINYPPTPFRSREEAFAADTYHAPTDRAEITGGTEKQNAYAADLRNRYINEMLARRTHLVGQRGMDQEYQRGVNGRVDGTIENQTEEEIAEIETMVARAARSTKARFWLNNMAGYHTASDVSNYFRSHPKAAQAPQTEQPEAQ